MNEAPTPYDILPPAPSPFVFSGAILTTAFALGLVAVLVVAFCFYQKKKKKVFLNVEEQVTMELRRLVTKKNFDEKEMNSVRVLLVRYLSYFLNNSEILTFTGAQLKALKVRNDHKVVQEITDALIQIEDRRFSFDTSLDDLDKILDRILVEIS